VECIVGLFRRGFLAEHVAQSLPGVFDVADLCFGAIARGEPGRQFFEGHAHLHLARRHLCSFPLSGSVASRARWRLYLNA